MTFSYTKFIKVAFKKQKNLILFHKILSNLNLLKIMLDIFVKLCYNNFIEDKKESELI